MGFIITVFKIVIILGFLVLIHETGHFLVARLCKIKVNEFAIGFGPLLWSKQTEKTKYSLRLIPLRWICEYVRRRRAFGRRRLF